MNLVKQLPYLPHFPSSSCSKIPHTSLTFHTSCSLSNISSSSSSSPFTEKHSLERYQRDSWLYKDPSPQTSCSLPIDSGSIRDTEIALQLPELKKLLQVLREKREGEEGAHGNGERKRRVGDVFLVGTGPGDPELLTLKAVRVIKSADLLLYDRLVSNEVLELVKDDARLLYVGKTAGYHSRTQEEIHELLLSFAEAGAIVVRLKGGDPLVFGRGGEEMDFLQQQGIQVKVVPGITAASGIAAELGIPLTHRGVANSVRFLTGHSRKGGKEPLFVSEHAADSDSTLVVYMGLSTLPSLVQKLVHHGLAPDTPAAAVERGTTPLQRTVFAELKDLVDEVTLAKLVSPTLIVIGKVVALSPFWPNLSKEATEMVETRQPLAKNDIMGGGSFGGSKRNQYIPKRLGKMHGKHTLLKKVSAYVEQLFQSWGDPSYDDQWSSRDASWHGGQNRSNGTKGTSSHSQGPRWDTYRGRAWWSAPYDVLKISYGESQPDWSD